MPRAVSILSPQPLIAGTLATWECRIAFAGPPLTEGGRVKIAYDLRGESGYQNFAQGSDPTAVNYARAHGPAQVVLSVAGEAVQHAAHSAEALQERIDTETYLWRDLLGLLSSLNLHIATVTVESGQLRAGDVLTVTFGDTSQGSPGMTVPGQASRHWRHWVAVQRAPEAPLELLGGDSIVVQPGQPIRLNVVAPSVVDTEEQVAVRHVALDERGNPVCRARVSFPPAIADDVLAEDDAEEFVDRIEVADERVGLSGASNPVAVIAEPELRLFWGDLHGHTVMSDGGARTPDEYYVWGRDSALLDFCAVSDHGFGIALYEPEKNWQVILQAAREFLEPGSFVTIPGWEISHAGITEGQVYGHKNVYFVDEAPPFYSSSPYGKDRARIDYTHTDELMELLVADGVEFMVIDHTSHMMTDWRRFDHRHTRLVECYSLFGASEAMDCPCAVGGLLQGKTARDGLNLGYRLGFTAGTDTHMGAPGAYRETSFGRGQVPGLTAVWAHELTREAVFEALHSRRTYATRGARILLRTDINGWMMGQQFQLLAPDEPRDVLVDVSGVGELASVEIIHNGATLHNWQLDGQMDVRLQFEHSGQMEGLPSAPEAGYYYVRVIQKDGAMAWSSPTWAIRPDAQAQ